MKFVPTLAAMAALTALSTAATSAADGSGIALAIVYDTSGSMSESVRASAGGSSPKYIIANRALIAVARQIQTFSTNSAAGAPRKIETALFTFRGDQAQEIIKLGPFDESALEDWAKKFSQPAGGTPLGRALEAASKTVLKSPLPRKHVLIITDGMNTLGPSPDGVLPNLQHQADAAHSTLSVHFIAFDVAARTFNGVKKLGATVVSASDEKQLNTQLDFILQRKILLEDEEPAKKN